MVYTLYSLCWFVCFQRNGFLPYVRSGSSVVDGPGGAGNGGSSLTPPPVRTIPSKGKASKSNRKLKKPKAKFPHCSALHSCSHYVLDLIQTFVVDCSLFISFVYFSVA